MRVWDGSTTWPCPYDTSCTDCEGELVENAACVVVEDGREIVCRDCAAMYLTQPIPGGEQLMGYTDVILSQPEGGLWPKIRDMVGHRLVFFGVHSITEEPDNMKPGQTRQVATADFVDLDDGAGGIIQWRAKFDKPGVVNKLTVNKPTATMGVIQLGEAKVGQNPPFLLGDHTAADAQFFNAVWLPANRDALSGKAPQPAAQQRPAPQPQPLPVAYQQPAAVAYQQPALGQLGQQMAQLAAQGQQQMAQLGAQNATDGQTEPYTPEAIAAMQRMVDAGLIQVPR